MKLFFKTLLLLVLPFSANAFQGVMEFNINSADREWKMICSVKDSFLRAEIHLGSSHFQTILRNEEGLLLLDEMNKQVITADFERDKWGKPGEPQYKENKTADYEVEGEFNRDGLTGTIYSIRSERKDYRLEIATGMGALPGIFLDQFTSLRPLFEDGKVLLKEHPGMPVKIYRKKKSSKPILAMVSKTEKAIDPSIFVVGEGYIRAKMRFKMR